MGISKFFSVGIVVVLLLATGCDSFQKNPKEEKPDPKVATYLVTARALQYDFEIDASSPIGPEETITTKIRVTAECSGPSEALPENCDQNQPEWGYRDARNSPWVFKIEEPTAQETVVEATLHTATYLEKFKASETALTDKQTFQTTFFPNNVPKGLKVQGGLIEFTVTTKIPAAERQTATEPYLKTVNKQLHFEFETAGASFVEDTANISYKGPDTTIAEVGIVDGVGTPGASTVFSVVSPRPGDPVTPGMVPVKVRFTSSEVGQHYRGVVVIRTANAKPTYINVTGSR